MTHHKFFVLGSSFVVRRCVPRNEQVDFVLPLT